MAETPSPQPATANMPAPAKSPAPASAPPRFDVVRVEPSGDTVLAGKGAPNADVALVASGKVVAEAKADPNGQFVILPPALKPGDYDLTLRQKDGAGPATDSAQSVAVSVPKARGGSVVVALAEPGRPTKLLSAPPTGSGGAKTPDQSAGSPVPKAKALPVPEAAANKTEPPAKVADAKPRTEVASPPALRQGGPALGIRSVDLENGTGFFASGVAAPSTAIHVYLNNSHIADVVSGPGGQWSVTIRKGLTGGHYVVRADAFGEGGAVTARVEVPFDVPVAMAAAASAPSSGKPDAAISGKRLEANAPILADRSSRDAPPPPSAPNPSEAAGAMPAAARKLQPDTAPVVSVPASLPRPAAPHIEAAAADGQPRSAASAVAEMKPQSNGLERAANAENAVIDQVDTALVVTGDNLWNISRARLGQGRRYTQIYAANTAQIRDPRLIYPGQVFVVPAP